MQRRPLCQSLRYPVNCVPFCGRLGPGPRLPILKWFPPQGQPRTFVLYKPVTTVGRALGNDVAIPSHALCETHAQVLFDGRDFNLEEVDKQGEILVNGQRVAVGDGIAAIDEPELTITAEKDAEFILVDAA